MTELQQDVFKFETDLIQKLKLNIQSFYDWRAKDLNRNNQNNFHVGELLKNLTLDAEWNFFKSKHQGKLVKENSPYKDAERLSYPNNNNEFVMSFKSGRLERKGNLLKSWHPHQYVLTPGNFIAFLTLYPFISFLFYKLFCNN